MENVLKIKASFLFRGMALAKSLHLCKPRHAGLHAEALTLPVGIMLYALWGFRPRTHEAHMSGQNVPELWQLRKAERCQESLKTDEIRVMLIDIQAIHGEGVSHPAATDFFAERFSLLAANLHCGQEQQRQAHKQ